MMLSPELTAEAGWPPGSAPVVALGGEIDCFSAPELRDELLRLLRRRGPEVTLDLSAVTFLDCAGVSVLLATRRRAWLEGGSVRLIRVPPRVRRVISLLNLDAAFGLTRRT
jgi:anti-sigma B factor antagonist